MKLAIVLVTLPVVAVAGLSTRPLDPQGVGEREPVPSSPATQPASAPSAVPASGEIAVTLISKSGEVVDHDRFNLIRLDDGRTAKASSPDAKEGGQLIFTGLQPGRYEVEAKDFSTGYVDVRESNRSTLTISVADWLPTVVSGRVMRGETGVPGAEIWAQLYSWPQPRHAGTKSDAAGYFSLALPTTGEWTFHVRAPGWEPSGRAWNIVLGHNFAVTVPSEGKTDLRFAIPTGRISGIVRDSAGRPVPGHIMSFDGGTNWRGISETRSDASGRFAFHEVGAGRFLVSCGGALVWQADGSLADSPMACTRVELASAGAQVEGVELKLRPAGELDLETDTSDGPTPAGVWIFARPSDVPQGFWSMISATPKSGLVGPGANQAVRRLPAGPLALSLRAPGANLSAPIDAVVTIEPGARTSASIKLVPATTVTVRAVDANSVPVFLRVVTVRASTGLELFLDGPEGDTILPLIRLRSLPPSEYTLTIADPAGRLYEQTITLNGEPKRDVLFQL